MYLYRAIDQFGQVIDVLVAEKRDLAATQRFFTRALEQAPLRWRMACSGRLGWCVTALPEC